MWCHFGGIKSGVCLALFNVNQLLSALLTGVCCVIRDAVILLVTLAPAHLHAWPLFWQLESRQPHLTVDDLIRILKEMERHDAVDVLQAAQGGCTLLYLPITWFQTHTHMQP